MTILNLENLIIKLNERKIKLSHLAIQPSVFLKWKDQGVIDFAPNKYKDDEYRSTSLEDHRFNAFESLWLLMVKELRELRVNIETIVKLKSFMFENALGKALEEITEEQYHKTKDVLSGKKEVIPLLKDVNYSNMFEYSNELPEGGEISSSRIGTIVTLILLTDENPSIQIVKTQDSHEVTFQELYPMMFYGYTKDEPGMFFSTLLNSMANNTSVNIPLRPLLNKFFEDPMLLEYTQDFKLYTPEEKKVLDIFRAENFEKITIYKNHGNNSIEIEQISRENIRGERARELRLSIGMKENGSAEVIFRNEKHAVVRNKIKTQIK